jgi:hypothetical protein
MYILYYQLQKNRQKKVLTKSYLKELVLSHQDEILGQVIKLIREDIIIIIIS